MNKTKRIAALILKLLQRELTPAECEQLDRWRMESPAHNAKFFELLNVGAVKEKVALYRSIDPAKAWERFKKIAPPEPQPEKKKKVAEPARVMVSSTRARTEFETCP